MKVITVVSLFMSTTLYTLILILETFVKKANTSFILQRYLKFRVAKGTWPQSRHRDTAL